MRAFLKSYHPAVPLSGLLVLLCGLVALICAVSTPKNLPPPSIPDSLRTQVAAAEGDLRIAAARDEQLKEEVANSQRELGRRKEECAKLTGRLEAHRAEITRLESERTARAELTRQRMEAARQEAEKESAQTRQTQEQIDNEALVQGRLEKMLETSRFNVVQVLSEDRKIIYGTGFFLDQDASSRTPWVITTRIGSPKDKPVLIRLVRDSEKKAGEGDGQDAKYEVILKVQGIWRDDATGLVFLTPASPPPEPLTTHSVGSLSEVKVGDRVYAFGLQGEAGTLLDNSVIEGNVSALERELEGQKFLQLSLPANPGSSGATVLDRHGKLVAVLVESVEGLERTSIAVPSADLRGALERFMKTAPERSRGKAVVVNAPTQEKKEPAKVDPAVAAQNAALEQPASYDEKKAIDYPAATQLVLTGHPYDRRMVYPGPRGLLIVMDWERGQCQGYLPGNSTPVWFYRPGNQFKHSVVDTRSVSLLWTETTLTELDLQTGKPRRSWQRPPPGRQILGRTVCGFRDFYLFFSNNCMVFDTKTGDYLPSFDYYNKPVLREGDFLWLIRVGEKGERGLYRVGIHDYLDIVQRTEAVKGSVTVTKTNVDRIKAIGKPVLGWDSHVEAEDRLLHVSQTMCVLGDITVYAFTPTGMHTQRLNMPPHSQVQAPWFMAYLPKQNEPQTRNTILDVTPSGQYLLTTGHLVDTRTLKPVAELPVPCLYAGFSDDRTIFLVDPVRQRIGFWSVDTLIKNQLSKP